jgi:hypothetical protein
MCLAFIDTGKAYEVLHRANVSKGLTEKIKNIYDTVKIAYVSDSKICESSKHSEELDWEVSYLLH